MTKTAFILNFFKLYNTAWSLALPFLSRNRRLQQGFSRRTAASHLSKADIWIQAASAGEAYLAVNIAKHLSPSAPLKLLITTLTTQGMDILKSGLVHKDLNPNLHLTVEWFPFDMPAIIQGAVCRVNPGVMVLLETEIWPALLFSLKKNRTCILIINARLSQKSFHAYGRTKFLWKHLAPDLVLATSAQDAERYRQVFETSCVKTMSNIKFDCMDPLVPDTETLLSPVGQIFSRQFPLTILASVRKQEEKQVLSILTHILSAFPNQVVAIFPRHLDRINAWKKYLAALSLPFEVRSEINQPLEAPGIILWDTFGELKTAYSLASAVFVGGSLTPLGGQNFIEPAVQGAVTLTGPYTEDFVWTTPEIFNKGIVHKKDHWKPIARALVDALKNPGDRSGRRYAARQYLCTHQGGTRQACHEILKAFDQTG